MQILPRLAAALLAAFALLSPVLADEAAIRKNIGERLADFPKIDEISKTPIPGLWEIRMGGDILYTDENGQYVVQGSIIETRSRNNLTEARLDKINAIDFASLPLKDAIVWKQGTGARKLVVFADPNCGYCKKFERELQSIKNVTVYTFLYPILGGDSPEKSRNIWCAKDRTDAWRDWMLDGATPPRGMGACDTAALQRNLEFGRKHRVNGTPSILFEDGKRVPGAMAADAVEKQFAASKSAKG